MYQNKMRKIRMEKGMTLKEVAEKTGISVGYLCHLEIGTRKNPSTEIMDKIAIALNRSIGDIFFD
ncbi:MAG: helix-turn-helix domain-containing protein [Clostridia bacterium]